MTRPFSVESAHAHQLVGDPNHAELFRYLDTTGDGSGSKDANVVANTFLLTPPAGMMYIIDTIRIVGWDNAVASGGTFIGASVLTTGCKLEIRQGNTVIQDLTDGLLIKSNGDLACLGDLTITNGTGQTVVQCNIAPSAPLRLGGNRSDSLVFQSQVTLAGLLGFRIMALGRAYTNTL